MTPEQFHEQIWKALKPINKEEFHAVASVPPTAEAVSFIETSTGIKIPEEFATFSMKTNGLCIMAKESVWPEAKLFDVAPAWTFHCGVVLLGIDTDDLPEWASILEAYKQLVERFEITDVLPLLTIYGDGNHVWGVRKDGAFVEVYDDEINVLDKEFTDVYSEEIEALMQRLNDMKKRVAARQK